VSISQLEIPITTYFLFYLIYECIYEFIYECHSKIEIRKIKFKKRIEKIYKAKSWLPDIIDEINTCLPRIMKIKYPKSRMK
jgi:hypothetical protein